MRKRNPHAAPVGTVLAAAEVAEPDITHRTSAHMPAPANGMNVDFIRDQMIRYEITLKEHILRFATSLREIADRVEREAKGEPSEWNPADAVDEVIGHISWGGANLNMNQLVIDLKRVETWRALLVAATNGTEGFREHE